jgi:hypothetical protein
MRPARDAATIDRVPDGAYTRRMATFTRNATAGQIGGKTMVIDEVARRMFARNVEDYAEPALTELAWTDPEIREFWITQAEAVLNDLVRLIHEDEPMIGRSSAPGRSSAA